MLNTRLSTILLLITGISLSCKTEKPGNLEEMARLSARPEAVLVRSVPLTPSTFYHELISNGKAWSSEKAVVPFRINGIITRLSIRNGQKVNTGELLAIIDDFEYKAKLDQAKMGLEKAEINFRDDLLTTFRTTDTAGLSQPKIKMSRIRSGLNDAIAALQMAEYNFNNTRIHSPISGIVANLDAMQWNPSQNYKNLCTIIYDEVMEVEFPVIESEYGFISRGMPVGIIPFINDSTLITGRVTQVNPQVDENGMVKVRAEFRNNGRLIDGMNVKVVIRKPVPDKLVVPREALVIRQGKDVIFVRQDSLAIWKYVTVEYENSTSVAIKEGESLAHGDNVIISGNLNLAHETIVREQ